MSTAAQSVSNETRPHLPISVLIVCGVVGFLGAKYPSVESATRLTLSLYPFWFILHFKRRMLKSFRLWTAVCTLLLLHLVLLRLLWSIVYAMNFWLLIEIIIAETVFVGLIVIRVAPAPHLSFARTGTNN